MNPSVLFPQIEAKNWKRIEYPESHNRPTYKMICNCATKGTPLYKLDKIPTSDQWQRVHLESYLFRDPLAKKDSHFYIGKCDLCGIAYWCSNNLEWIFLLNDEQRLLTCLNQLLVKTIHYTYSTFVFNGATITICNHNPSKGQPELKFIFQNGDLVDYQYKGAE